MKKLFCSLMASLMLFGCSLIPIRSGTCDVRWTGEIDNDFYKQAVQDLDNAKRCSVLRVELSSPGGSVVTTLDTVYAMRKAQKAGLVIEIHGGAMVASGATLLVGAGSHGRRFVRDNSFSLVHGVQTANMFQQKCEEYNPDASTEGEKSLNHFIVILVREYSVLSGKSIEEVSTWLRCDNSQIGFGALMVKLGLADHVEK